MFYRFRHSDETTQAGSFKATESGHQKRLCTQPHFNAPRRTGASRKSVVPAPRFVWGRVGGTDTGGLFSSSTVLQAWGERGQAFSVHVTERIAPIILTLVGAESIATNSRGL